MNNLAAKERLVNTAIAMNSDSCHGRTASKLTMKQSNNMFAEAKLAQRVANEQTK